MDRRHEFALRFPGAIILPYLGAWPEIADTAFVAPGAVVIGNVTLGEDVSVWFNTTLRGDIAPISIGSGSNVQDGSVVHVNSDAPVVVGERTTIGHTAIVHGTTIGDDVMIGMGAIIMSYTRIGSGSVIAAGALLTERTIVEPGSIMVGVPAKQRSELDRRQQEALSAISGRYVGVQANYRAMLRELGADDGKQDE
jgi:carbonic anhydrase/acetyltransferase-like protein (isoleucine patch superfamily)